MGLSDAASGLTSGALVADRFRLDRPIRPAQGVWLAEDTVSGRTISVRLFDPEITKRRATVVRLIEGARGASALRHPAIVRIYGAGLHQERVPYVVLEALEGRDLADALRERGRMAAVGAVQCLLPIAHALAYAHERNIVHRDLRPENVVLSHTEEGNIQPKLVDFGLAKVPRAGGRITAAGVAVGTPRYMAPEQTRGAEVGPSTDVWGLSVLLYELVVGKPPFDGASLEVLLNNVCTLPAKPFDSFGVGDAALWSVVERGLSKAPEERWPSVRELGDALAGWLQSVGIEHDITGALVADQWTLAAPARMVAAAGGGAEAGGWQWPVKRQKRIFASNRAPEAVLSSPDGGRTHDDDPLGLELDWPPRESAPPSSPRPALGSAFSREGVTPSGVRATPQRSEAKPEEPPRRMTPLERAAILGNPNAKIAVLRGVTPSSGLSATEMFLASRLDGLTIAEAIAGSSLHPQAVRDVICRLVGLGVIRVT